MSSWFDKQSNTLAAQPESAHRVAMSAVKDILLAEDTDKA
jgi:hypothetical protein